MNDLATDIPRRADAIHEHGWVTESGHQTSAGRVVYVRCAGCGTRRVDIQSHPLVAPRSLSIEIP
jgi:hypothetical protein